MDHVRLGSITLIVVAELVFLTQARFIYHGFSPRACGVASARIYKIAFGLEVYADLVGATQEAASATIFTIATATRTTTTNNQQH